MAFICESVQIGGTPMTFGCSNQLAENKLASVINTQGVNDVNTQRTQTHCR